jgi:hypothetical protein
LADLPDRVAVAIEELPAAPEPVPEPVKPDASVEELFAKLSAIKKQYSDCTLCSRSFTQPGCGH